MRNSSSEDPKRRKFKRSELIFGIICLGTLAVGTFLILNIYGQRFGLIPMLLAGALLLFVAISLATYVRPKKPTEDETSETADPEDSLERDS